MHGHVCEGFAHVYTWMMDDKAPRHSPNSHVLRYQHTQAEIV
jgi:hypothetical protein